MVRIFCRCQLSRTFRGLQSTSYRFRGATPIILRFIVGLVVSSFGSSDCNPWFAVSGTAAGVSLKPKILIDEEKPDSNNPPTERLDTKMRAEESPIDPLNNKRPYKVKQVHEVKYSKSENLHCTLYLPQGDGPFPAVIAIHGGAWQFGNRLQMLRHGWKLAQAGYVVMAIDYRLAPEHKYPAQVHDCKTAVRWVREKRVKLNVNPDQIAVFGYSAGGHLAAMLGTTDADDGLEGSPDDKSASVSTRVQCVVVGGGPCEFDWVKNTTLQKWLGSTRSENPKLYLEAAPIHYASADDPPFIFFHGENDRIVPPESSRKMHDRLVELGVNSQYTTVPGRGHLGTFGDTTWLDEAIAFMDSAMGRRDER